MKEKELDARFEKQQESLLVEADGGGLREGIRFKTYLGQNKSTQCQYVFGHCLLATGNGLGTTGRRKEWKICPLKQMLQTDSPWVRCGSQKCCLHVCVHMCRYV